jgi:16S rRNA (cytosine967-C5)-methyltransferase
MREPARLQAAIEILDAVIDSARDGGAAADTLFRRYFSSRRYAGAGDRAAVRELVFGAIRFAGDRPASGRAALLGFLEASDPGRLGGFDGSVHGPAPVADGEPRAAGSVVPGWLRARLLPVVGEEGARALLSRAPLDLRVNRLKATRADVLERLGPGAQSMEGLPGGLPVALPHGVRLAEPVPLERDPLLVEGQVAVQDAGSQAVAALVGAEPGMTVVDLCAGAGGKTLALAADMAGEGRIVACDTDRRRLRELGPRARLAGAAAMIEERLLDPGKEAERLLDLAGAADRVLVDAPCSGTGTWRRTPDLRWRLDPARLGRLTALQGRLLKVAAPLVRPGGRLVYAVCSVLEEEGVAQTDAFLAASPGFGREGHWLLTPQAHGCDGFFVACLRREC